MGVYFGIVSFAALVGTASIIWVARRNRWRFGQVVARGALSRGAGPYRGGEVPALENRPVPRTLFIAAATSIAWGIATFFGFAPAGLLLCLVLFDGGFLAGLGGVFLAFICFAGLALAVALFVKAAQLFRRDATGLGGIATLSRWHHGIVFGFFLIASIAAGKPAAVVATVIGVGAACGMGALQAGLLDRARLRLLRLDAEELAPAESFSAPPHPARTPGTQSAPRPASA